MFLLMNNFMTDAEFYTFLAASYATKRTNLFNAYNICYYIARYIDSIANILLGYSSNLTNQ